MKKLLAWLLSFFMALSANVEYTRQQDEHEYDPSQIYYYKSDFDHYDYRAQEAKLGAATAAVSCRSEAMSASRPKKVKYNENDRPSTEAYWFENGEVVSIDEIPDDSKEYTITKAGEIVIPYAGRLTTENLQANDATSMEVVCVINSQDAYRITITGMEMWYCDKNRDEVIFHDWENPDANGKYRAFRAGDCLGYAIAGETKIVVNPMSGGSVDNRTLTVRDFFMQK